MSNSDRKKYGTVSFRIRKQKLTKSAELRSRLQCYCLVASKSLEAKVIVRS